MFIKNYLLKNDKIILTNGNFRDILIKETLIKESARSEGRDLRRNADGTLQKITVCNTRSGQDSYGMLACLCTACAVDGEVVRRLLE